MQPLARCAVRVGGEYFSAISAAACTRCATLLQPVVRCAVRAGGEGSAPMLQLAPISLHYAFAVALKGTAAALPQAELQELVLHRACKVAPPLNIFDRQQAGFASSSAWMRIGCALDEQQHGMTQRSSASRTGRRRSSAAPPRAQCASLHLESAAVVSSQRRVGRCPRQQAAPPGRGQLRASR